MDRPFGGLLAGGRGSRLGRGEKALVEVGGVPMARRAAAVLAPHVEALALNANGPPARFAALGLEVVPDRVREEGGAGPLAGIHALLAWARARGGDGARVVTAPADAPFLPADLVPRLDGALRGEEADVAVARSGGRSHPVCACWRAALAGPLEDALLAGVRKIDLFTGSLAVAPVPWPDAPRDPFFNVNRPGDLERAEAIAAEGEAPGEGGAARGGGGRP